MTEPQRMVVERRTLAVDADVHPIVTSTTDLLPYLPEYRQDALRVQMIPEYAPNFHPPNAPISQRPDARRDEAGRAGTEVEGLVADVFADGLTDVAILNCLYGVQMIHQPQTEREMAHAINCWLVDRWLDRDDRLRASIIVPLSSPQAAAAEIERWEGDRRFVQVMLLAGSESPYGRDVYWPIWEAAERAGLPVMIHLGSLSRNPPTPAGWPSTYVEWYAMQQGSMESQLASILAEGVFQKFPATKVVIAEGGFAWAPSFMWRLSTLWKGYRSDTPWLKEIPADVLRQHVRFTTSPADGASAPGQLDAIVDRLGSDEMLLYASDYPHWHATDPGEIRNGTVDQGLVEKLLRTNPSNVYEHLN